MTTEYNQPLQDHSEIQNIQLEIIRKRYRFIFGNMVNRSR